MTQPCDVVVNYRALGVVLVRFRAYLDAIVQQFVQQFVQQS